jgi:hypothetical protein
MPWPTRGLSAEADARVVTSNSIPHATNDIDLTPLLDEAVSQIAPPEDGSGFPVALCP